MRRAPLTALLLTVASSAFALGEATNVHGSFPYYYTGYYQYGNSPYTVVPNYRTADASHSYLFSPYYYSYSSTGFYGKPVTKRPWSFGYLSNGVHGAYYY